jgi:hypothetical protein
MRLQTESYAKQQQRRPQEGRVILAQYHDDSIVVYQAYAEPIGRFAATHGYFGGDFKLSRMTWIKPSFLWMMYRSGWGTKDSQEVVLAIRLQRSAFDEVLSLAAHSTFKPNIYASRDDWKTDVARSNVRVQWDPDRSPVGGELQRRAIQLGLRGKVAARYAREWIREIEDISEFVREQREHAVARDYDRLLTPTEEVYPVADLRVAAKLELSMTAPDALKSPRIEDR